MNDLENGNINILLKNTLDSVDLDVTDIAENAVDTGIYNILYYINNIKTKKLCIWYYSIIIYY